MREQVRSLGPRFAMMLADIQKFPKPDEFAQIASAIIQNAEVQLVNNQRTNQLYTLTYGDKGLDVKFGHATDNEITVTSEIFTTDGERVAGAMTLLYIAAKALMQTWANNQNMKVEYLFFIADDTGVMEAWNKKTGIVLFEWDRKNLDQRGFYKVFSPSN